MRNNALSAFLSLVLLTLGLFAQSHSPSRTLITEAIDESTTITLAGNTRPEATVANDRGPVADSRQFQHMQLMLKRPAEREAAMEKYVADLSDSTSPNYHHWLTAVQVGEQFGPNHADIETVKSWLTSHGFTVNHVYPTGDLIDFSGNASHIRNAFHTQIHHLNVGGKSHLANMRDPQIPAALGASVKGVSSFNDFLPHPLVSNVHRMDASSPEFTATGGRYFVAPPDLATIYNLNPLYAANISGRGQTIVLLERTDLVNGPADWLAFRKGFALTKAYPYATFAEVHPQPGTAGNCNDPGVNGDDEEADLDVQWSSAAAPNAHILLASCADTDFNFGALIALENLLTNGDVAPSIVSLSYGGPETGQGSDGNFYINLIYRLAALEGVSVYVSTGDNDAAVADARNSPALYGINVNGLASTPYNVAVGGTDFSDSFFGTNSTYWNAANAPNGGSAKSYISEIPWNDSCGSTLIATYQGFATTYGANGLCNNGAVTTAGGLINIVGGSGGPSACATGTPDPSNKGQVVGGTCAGYPKPAWQSLVGVPNDGVRDLPDISLFASNGIWRHAYLFCYSDTTFGGVPCSQGLFGAGGTSFATPIMAGLQALVNQYTGSAWGNPNPVLYALARHEYGASGNASCNSSLGNNISSACIFHDVTLGDNDAVCTAGTPNCYAPSGALGVLSTSTSSYQPAFAATTGWDFTTGIGTVNGYNLVTKWLSVAP